MSPATRAEFVEVMERPRFERYVTSGERSRFLEFLTSKCLEIAPTEVIEVCRDPKDNMFLEPAVSAKASAIVTRDAALLALAPFRDIPILTPLDTVSASERNPNQN